MNDVEELLERRDKVQAELNEVLRKIYEPLVIAAIRRLEEKGVKPTYLFAYYHFRDVLEEVFKVNPSIADQLKWHEVESVLRSREYQLWASTPLVVTEDVSNRPYVRLRRS